MEIESNTRPTLAAALCPGANGVAANQARGLYQAITGRVFIEPANCSSHYGARPAPQHEKIDIIPEKANWIIEIFPNPASDELKVSSTVESEILKVEIRDPTGRVIFGQDVKVIGYIAGLVPSFPNGV